MQRRYPNQPIVGVAGIVFRDDEVVLIRRGQEPAKGEWSLPGGAVEVGETLEEALCREVWEETGLTIEVLGLSAIVNRIVRDEAGAVAYHYVLLDFLCRAGTGALQAGSDSADVILVPQHRLASLGLAEPAIIVIKHAWQQICHNKHLPPLLLAD